MGFILVFIFYVDFVNSCCIIVVFVIGCIFVWFWIFVLYVSKMKLMKGVIREVYRDVIFGLGDIWLGIIGGIIC